MTTDRYADRGQTAATATLTDTAVSRNRPNNCAPAGSVPRRLRSDERSGKNVVAFGR